MERRNEAMDLRIAPMGLLIAAMAYYVFVVPRMERTETVVPRASQN